MIYHGKVEVNDLLSLNHVSITPKVLAILSFLAGIFKND